MDFNSFNNFAVAPASEDGVSARFYDRTIKTQKLDTQGFPIFAEVCYCEIRLKDNVSEVFDQPATIDKIRRFPREYANYQQICKQAMEGTPLEQFAFLSKPEIESLKVRSIYSVEALAEIDDEKAHSLGVIKERDQARKFTEQAKNNQYLEKWRQKEEEYLSKISKLEETINSLSKKSNKRKNNGEKD